MLSNERRAGRVIGQAFVIVCILAASLASAWNGAQEVGSTGGAVRLISILNLALGLVGFVGLWWFLRGHPLALRAIAVWGVLGVVTAGTAVATFTPPESRVGALAGTLFSSALLMGLIWFVSFRIVRARKDT